MPDKDTAAAAPPPEPAVEEPAVEAEVQPVAQGTQPTATETPRAAEPGPGRQEGQATTAAVTTTAGDTKQQEMALGQHLNLLCVWLTILMSALLPSLLK